MTQHSPAVSSRARAPALLAIFATAIWFAACQDGPTAYGPKPTVGLKATALVNNPDSGCWVAQNPAYFGSGSEGGSPPWTNTICGVSVSVSWPGHVPGNGFTETNVRNGLHQYPWANTPGALGFITFTGWPWTVSFDGSVKNVRVYTRLAEFAGGKVVLRNGAGVVLAEQPIPISPTTTTGLDTIAFADTGVRTLEIIPAPDVTLSNAPEKIMWSAQFEGAQGQQQLCQMPEGTGVDTLGRRAFNSRAVREELERMMARSDTNLPILNRHEEVTLVFKNPDGSFRFDHPAVTNNSHCGGQFNVPLDDVTLVAVMHTHPYLINTPLGCPGIPSKRYEPDLTGAASPADHVSKLLVNSVRGLNLGSNYLIPYFIIDMDFAWYLPWDSFEGQRGLPRISRRAGQSGIGCRWL